MKRIYPKNKEKFKELIPYAKKIIKLCKANRIPVAIYGSFGHFYHTRDEKIKVNDIDLLIPERCNKKMIGLLEKKGIKFKQVSKESIVTKDGKLKVEVDNIGKGYKNIKEKLFSSRGFPVGDFYGLNVGIMKLKHYEEMYPVAYKRSRDDKARILKRIRHLEKYLGRKLL